MRKQRGYILQRGTSPIDGHPFVVIITMESANRKTGNMCQVWILREDVNPVEAVKNGQDLTVCGTCPHRKQSDGTRTCYVNVGQAPLSVWRAFHTGKYRSDLHVLEARDAVKGRKIRFGAYGDPALIDPMIFHILTKYCEGYTAYTHQWRESYGQWTKGKMQASCEGLADYLEASAHGWKAFSVSPKGSIPKHSAILCPATRENSAVTCSACTLCNGSSQDIYVEAHGPSARAFSEV